jgi:YfiH family protein
MSVLTVAPWDGVPGLAHGFLSRASPGGDRDPTNGWAAEIAAHGISCPTVVVPRQEHGTRIHTVTEPPSVQPAADALLTGTAGFIVGVTTADCVPLLLLAPQSRVAAAVHAGWRGTLAGIVPGAVNVVASEARAGPAELRAAIGPAIGGCCYEIGAEVRAAFEARYGARFTAPALTTTSARPHLNLRLFVSHQLAAAGLPRSAIDIVGPCTACDSTYSSYRRDGPAAGRQLSFVGWLE